MMRGVRKIINSVFSSLRVLCLKRFPSKGMSPRSGILLSDCILALRMRPPMITVWPSGVTTTVSAERVSMTGAKTPGAGCSETENVRGGGDGTTSGRSNAARNDVVRRHREVGHKPAEERVPEVVVIGTLDPEIQAVVAGHLHEDNFDQDLRFGLVEV